MLETYAANSRPSVGPILVCDLFHRAEQPYEMREYTPQMPSDLNRLTTQILLDSYPSPVTIRGSDGSAMAIARQPSDVGHGILPRKPVVQPQVFTRPNTRLSPTIYGMATRPLETNFGLLFSPAEPPYEGGTKTVSGQVETNKSFALVEFLTRYLKEASGIDVLFVRRTDDVTPIVPSEWLEPAIAPLRHPVIEEFEKGLRDTPFSHNTLETASRIVEEWRQLSRRPLPENLRSTQRTARCPSS